MYRGSTFGTEPPPGKLDRSQTSMDSPPAGGHWANLQRILLRFADRTSMQGIPYIRSSRSTMAKLVWFFLLLLGLLLLAGHLYYLCIVYYSYPKHSTLDLGFSPLDFPAVTFCNVNPIRRSRLDTTPEELRSLVRLTDPNEIVEKMIAGHDTAEEKTRRKRAAVPSDDIDKKISPQNGTHAANNDIGSNSTVSTDNSSSTSSTPTFDQRGGKQFIRFDFKTIPRKGQRSRNNTKATTTSSPLTSSGSREERKGVTYPEPTPLPAPSTAGVQRSDQVPFTLFPISESSSSSSSFASSVSSTTPSPGMNTRETPPAAASNAKKDNRKPATNVNRKNTRDEEDESGEVPDTKSGSRDGKNKQGKKKNEKDNNKKDNNNNNNDNNNNNNKNNNNNDNTNNTNKNSNNNRNDTKKNDNRKDNDKKGDNMNNNKNNDNNNNNNNRTKPKGGNENTSPRPARAREMEYINGLDLGLEFKNTATRRKLEEEEGKNGEAKRRKRRRKRRKKEEAFTEPSVSASIREEFLLLYSNLSQELQQMVGHQAEDMIVDCSFSGRRCLPQNFTVLSSTMFGNCFTIDHPAMITTRGGYLGGMSLVIFLESDEYLHGVTTGTGIQIIIHPHNTLAFPEEDGMAVMSGTETNIALRRLNINRLGKPYGDCQNGEVFSEKYGHTYTRRACQLFCEHGSIMDKCQCYSEQGGQHVRRTLERDLPPCQTDEEVRCMLDVQYDFEEGFLQCDCQNPCHEQSYYKTVSMRHWPADEYTKVLVETLCRRKNETECAKYRQAPPRTIAQSFVKINIFYEDLNHENITEVEDYEPSQFASDVGGTVGLWLGLSFLSAFEVIQFLGEVIIYFLTFGPCRKQRKKSEAPERELDQHSVATDSSVFDFSGY